GGAGGSPAAGSGGAPAGTGGSASGGAGVDGGGGSGSDAAAGRDAPIEQPVSVPGVTIIQEDQPGFDAVDGKVLPRQGGTSVTGYTGTGFADSDSGLGKRISW